MSESESFADENIEVVKPRHFTSELGAQIVMSEKQELGDYRVGDTVKFKRENTLPFGQIEFLSQLQDDELKVEIIGISLDDKLIVKLKDIDAFVEECFVEELNSSKA